jgi:hypothetical protein
MINYQTKGALQFLCIVFTFAMQLACATSWDPAEHGVSVLTTGTDTARIVNAHVFDQKNGLLIAAEVDVDSDHPILMKMPGQVVVEVTGADGGIIASYQPDGYKNLLDHYVTYQRFTFSVAVAAVPAAGNVIRLIYRPRGTYEMKM